MDCDVIIYDALDSDLDEIKLAIKSTFSNLFFIFLIIILIFKFI